MALHTYTEVMGHQVPPQGKSSQLRVCWVSRLLLPVMSLVFTIVFWMTGLMVSYWPNDQHGHNLFDCLNEDSN